MADSLQAPALPPDWTDGVEALLYEACTACGHRAYFRRGFCAACGGAVESLRCTGTGTVYAATVVVRAPSSEWKAAAPYALLLVDLAEGVRAMVHGEEGLAVGEPVRVGWTERAGRLVPFARRLDSFNQ
jgi:uncharacterized protein